MKKSNVFDCEGLLRRLMGDERLAGAVLRSFIADCPGKLSDLRQRIAAADGPGARGLAHTLKGAAATVSAETLHLLAKAVEEAATGQCERCGNLMPRMEEEFERFHGAVATAGWVTNGGKQ